ncbi:MAG TPA: contractile injection system tape measure protein, partial [Rhodocyclaceae bacterium]
MAERHLIGEAIFDVAFASPELARRRQGELAVFFRDRLMPLVEQVLDEFSGTPASIDHLEVDLGNFSEARVERDMPQRFQEGLRAALRGATATQVRQAQEAAGAAQAQRQLRRFLETGRVERDTDPKTADLIGETLLAVARADPAGFAEYLQRAPRREAILRRLAKQFPANVLMELMRLLSAAYARPEGAAGGIAASHTDADWEAALAAILAPAAAGSSGGGRSGEATVARTQASAAQETRADLGEAAGDWQFARALAGFDAALAQGATAELIERWREMRAGSAVKLRSALMQRLADEELRQRLVAELPEALWLDGLKLLLGASSGVVERLLVELNGPAEGALRQRLWANTLAYLQRQGAATFDAANYLAALRTHWREEDDEGEMGTASAETAALQAALARIDHFAPAEAEAEVPSPAPSAAEAAYARIVQRLGGQTQQDITADIVKLAKSHPELLRQLQQQLAAAELTLDLPALSARETKQLARSLIGQDGAPKAAEFWRAIERHAHDAADEARYYRHIVDSLITGRIVDLQQAIEQAATAATSTAAKPDHPPAPEAERAGPEADTPLAPQALLRLRLEEALALGRPESLNDIWATLLREQQSLLRAVFTQRLG